MNNIIKTSDWGACVAKPIIDPATGKAVQVATLDCISVILQNVVNFLAGFAAVLAVFFIVWAGIQFVKSEGDKEKIVNARKTLTYATLGLLFVALVFIMLNLIAQFTGSQGFFKNVIK